VYSAGEGGPEDCADGFQGFLGGIVLLGLKAGVLVRILGSQERGGGGLVALEVV